MTACAYSSPSCGRCESCDPPAPLPVPPYDSEAFARFEIRQERASRPEDDQAYL